jgi:uncharacterized membrane protein YgcG
MILEFVPNPAEEGEGLSDSSIEHFRDDPFASTAREPGQNSRDAFVSLPVRVTFDLLEEPTAQFPAIDRLSEVVAICAAQAKAGKKQKETSFFQQAAQVLKQDKLKILRIADFNTTGVIGPSVAGTPFHSLLRGAGISEKPGETSLGSFGIGKAAVYTVSDLQTVFYSTVYSAGGQPHFLAQGKSLLTSHSDEQGAPRRRAGYWGLSKFQPISNPADVPPWLRRTEQGTSVFAIGFRETPNWQRRFACSLIQNFFCAIHDGEMEFAVDSGKIEIGRLNLESLFDDPQMQAVAQESDQGEQFEMSRNLYRCLVSPDASEQIVTLPGLGQVKIRVLVADGLPKKVCILRNGMVITDNLDHFGEKFVRFPMYKDFIAVVIPMVHEGQSFLRKLEDPKHKEFSAERLADPDAREPAKVVMRRLAKTIRETIKSYTRAEFADEVSVDELRKYFATEPEAAPQPGAGAADDPETIKYDIEPARTKKTNPRATAKRAGQSGSGGGKQQTGTGGGGGGGGGGGSSSGAQPGRQGSASEIILHDFRNVRTPQNDRARSIFFTPNESGTATIVVEATGIAGTEDLPVRSAAGSLVSNGRIKRQLTANERTRIDLELTEPYTGPIELRVSVEPEGGAANEN